MASAVYTGIVPLAVLRRLRICLVVVRGYVLILEGPQADGLRSERMRAIRLLCCVKQGTTLYNSSFQWQHSCCVLCGCSLCAVISSLVTLFIHSSGSRGL